MTCVNLFSNDSHWTQVTWAGAVPLAVILAVPHCRNPSSGGCEEMNTATPHDHMAALTHVPRSVHSEQAVKLRAPKLTVVCAVYARANFPENMSVERHTWWTHQGCGENILERWDSPEGTLRFFSWCTALQTGLGGTTGEEIYRRLNWSCLSGSQVWILSASTCPLLSTQMSE